MNTIVYMGGLGMILNSVTKHVKEQNWFAVFVDFLIVVVGVFIGIQVANWNESQALNDKEAKLLIELKREIKMGVDATTSKGDAYRQVTVAAIKSLAVLSQEDECETLCWLILVDFMHASQWQDIRISRSIYDEMRKLGLPRSRTIIDSFELVLAQNEGNAVIFDDKPVYRNRIRQLIPFAAQKFYWNNCYTYTAGVETYLQNCPEGITKELASKVLKTIHSQPDIKRHLTAWASDLVTVPSNFDDQNTEALKTIALIDAELQHR